MEKINYRRMILGGILGSIVFFFVGFLFHGVILESHYLYFQGQGSVLHQVREMGWMIHIAGHIVSGFALSLTYVMARKFWGPGPMTAIRAGLIVALFTAGGTAAEYAMYNFGTMIPVMTFANNIVGATLATLAAGVVYKD